MKSLISSFFLLIGMSAAASVGVVPAGTFEILKSFRFQDQSLSEAFIKNFPLLVRIEAGLLTSFTFLISNSFESQFDAPVFLRQTLTAAKKIGNKTVVYVVSYVRSNPMGKTKQFFAEGVIEKMQSKVFDEIALMHQKKGN